MESRKERKSSWEWYSVKLLFESIITGEPAPKKIDRNYSSDFKTYEERIIIVKAQSYKHAYILAYNNISKSIKTRGRLPCFELEELCCLLYY